MHDTPDGAGQGRYEKRHLSLDPGSSARLDRLALRFDRKPSHVVCRALELLEDGTDRLTRHALREPLQALALQLAELRRHCAAGVPAELLDALARSVETLTQRAGSDYDPPRGP